MRSYADAVAYAQRQHTAPTRDWTRDCQMFARNCVGAAAWAGSAIKAFYAIPRSHRHSGVGPAGSLTYFKGGTYGHVVFMVEGGYCWSNDIVRKGKIDKVHVSVIHKRWPAYSVVGWIDWTPSGAINLKPRVPVVDLSNLYAAFTRDPSRPQGTFTYRADVATFERGLDRLNYLDPSYVEGHYGTETITAVKRLQKSLGMTPTGAPNTATVTYVGRKTGFTVKA